MSILSPGDFYDPQRDMWLIHQERMARQQQNALAGLAGLGGLYQSTLIANPAPTSPQPEHGTAAPNPVLLLLGDDE